MSKPDKTDREIAVGVSREIARDVYFMEIGKGYSRSNIYFVRSGSSWALIDAASANCGRLIRRTAESLFGANTRPASILLTHYHPDHSGSALELARTWGCPVYMHPEELPLATVGDFSTVEKYANPLDRGIILPVLRAMPRQRVESMLSKDRIKDVAWALDPGGAVPGLPDWQCIPTPGHTPGHIAFFRAGDRTLITGDAVVTADLNSFRGLLLWCLRLNKPRISGPPWYSTFNAQSAKESVATLAAFEPRVLASGHGMPVKGDGISAELRALS
jgi:glyoxylase-like metal-dependent hydrolase (beta-lactamase superfamily II)